MVIFKKRGKEWHYGKIVGNVNGRSYIIRDSFDNHFRRNRRFIAKSRNEDFNASDLMFEENVQSGSGINLPAIDIVRPQNNVNIELDVTPPPNDVIADELEQSVEIDNNISVSEYETADTDSDASGGGDSEPEVTPTIRTRSGRISKPPQRYGW